MDGADEGFATVPLSIGEHRAARSACPSDASPRDVLVGVLRDIDSGKLAADHVIVSLGISKPDGGRSTEYRQAGKLDGYAQVGLLTRVIHMMERKS